MFRKRMIALCALLPLLLASCAPGTGGGPTPAPAAPDPNAPARFSQDETAIAGLTLGVSTMEDVMARFGEPVTDATTSDEQYKLENRYLTFGGVTCILTRNRKDAVGTEVLTSFSIVRDVGIEGPRGIHIGMTTEELEALFPRETTRVGAVTGSTIEYLYAEEVVTDAKDGQDRVTPPYGAVSRPSADPSTASYNFMSAYDWPFLKPKRTGRPGVYLQVNCEDGKVTDIILGVGPLVV